MMWEGKVKIKTCESISSQDRMVLSLYPMTIDHSRFAQARVKLEWISESEQMAGVAVVVLANKLDCHRLHLHLK